MQTAGLAASPEGKTCRYVPLRSPILCQLISIEGKATGSTTPGQLGMSVEDLDELLSDCRTLHLPWL